MSSVSRLDTKATEQASAEADVDKFRQQLGPFVVAAETTRMPMVFTDAAVPRDPIIFANDSFLKLTGYSREEVLGQSLHDLLATGADEAAMHEIAAAFDGGKEICPDIHYTRKDGGEFWGALFICPVRDEQGKIVQYFMSIADLTKERQEQAHAQTLIAELNHRVKNTLSTVQSIVTQALRRSSDREVVTAIESRLMALSRSHDLLTMANWESVGLHDTVTRALEPFGYPAKVEGRLSVEGENLQLGTKATLALSVAFHELATNAVKYGALSSARGRVAVRWHVERGEGDSERLKLSWVESGGPPVVPPIQRGFGSRVLERGLGFELQGKVDLAFQPEGVVCKIDVPWPLESR